MYNQCLILVLEAMRKTITYIHTYIYIYIYMLVERHNKMTYNLQQRLSEIITHNNINVMPIKFS